MCMLMYVLVHCNSNVSLSLQAVINTMCGQGMQELPFLQAGAFIHTNGCIDKLVNWIHSNLFMLGGIALGLAIPQVDITHTCRVYSRVGVHSN